MDSRACYRCGVEFDGSDYLPDSPCADCQLDLPGEYRKLNAVRRDEKTRKDDLVRKFWKRVLSDRQIGVALGIDPHEVYRVRKRLDLAAHDLGGSVNWAPGESDRISERMKKQWRDNPPKPWARAAQRTGLLESQGDKHGWEKFEDGFFRDWHIEKN